MKVNSLNNRFLPFDFINTDAVISADDDFGSRDGIIDTTFDVWKSNHNSLVGMFSRYAGRDLETNLSTYENPSQKFRFKYNLVLTGGAMFHKKFLFAYTFTMDQRIGDHTHKMFNCEDIAMNFLAAHLYPEAGPIKTSDIFNLIGKYRKTGSLSLRAVQGGALKPHKNSLAQDVEHRYWSDEPYDYKKCDIYVNHTNAFIVFNRICEYCHGFRDHENPNYHYQCLEFCFYNARFDECWKATVASGWDCVRDERIAGCIRRHGYRGLDRLVADEDEVTTKEIEEYNDVRKPNDTFFDKPKKDVKKAELKADQKEEKVELKADQKKEKEELKSDQKEEKEELKSGKKEEKEELKSEQKGNDYE
ncbi:unnamed protein product [Bursaphelenchus okinawaensis]|uniref:Glycosyl transferase 64 domain-containing protein n=1 Tax=Bursaphelenchus okinawaensis TaxID=465554 RepID=A0A811L541_9BILA|nr:unnamed protein product [Bursaphelenchus okinawaensis]CAG9117663.1 unnamed protein product [Bursaphelenchus okinawaensis]